MTITDILADLSNNENKLALISALPAHTFVPMTWPFLPKRHSKSVLVKLRQPLRATPLQVDKGAVAKLQYGKMYILNSGSLPIGYILDFPAMDVTVSHEIAVAKPASVKKLSKLRDECEKIVATQGLSIFVIDKTVQIAVTLNNGLVPPMF